MWWENIIVLIMYTGDGNTLFSIGAIIVFYIVLYCPENVNISNIWNINVSKVHWESIKDTLEIAYWKIMVLG